MFIPCRQCGAKNKLGAIFCRTCGARLDLKIADAELRRLQEPKHGLARIVSALTHVRQAAGIIALLLLILVLVGLFLRVPVRVSDSLDNQARALAERKFQEVLTASNGSGRAAQLEYVFSGTEVTVLANHYLGLSEAAARQDDPGFALRPERIWVELLPSGYVRLIHQTRTVRRLSMYYTLVGRFVLRDERLSFAPRSAKVGRVPMLGPLRQVVSDRFRALVIEEGLASTLAQRLDAIDVRGDELTLTVKPPPVRVQRPEKGK